MELHAASLAHKFHYISAKEILFKEKIKLLKNLLVFFGTGFSALLLSRHSIVAVSISSAADFSVNDPFPCIAQMGEISGTRVARNSNFLPLLPLHSLVEREDLFLKATT